MTYTLVGSRHPQRSDSSQAGWQNIYIENLTGHHHQTMISPGLPSIRSFRPVRIPADHYFMMGDNRDNSADSRFLGFIDRDRILGRATTIVISLDILNHYQPRWSRFFRGCGSGRPCSMGDTAWKHSRRPTDSYDMRISGGNGNVAWPVFPAP